MSQDHSGAEAARLAALRRYEILDTPPETAFDDLARVAALACGTPIAVVSLIDEVRQWFKAKVGIDATETPRAVAFCDHAIRRPDEIMVVPDATADTRFRNNPLVTGDTHIRFYAGAPLVTPDGYPLGTLCTIDRQARELTQEQADALGTLARQVVAQLELRREVTDLIRANAELRSALARRRLGDESVVTMCAWTQTMKLDSGRWVSVEEFLRDVVRVQVVHGISEEAYRMLTDKLPDVTAPVPQP
ncbi:GAF domain-containing protein [Fimbriiglobus ruber]|uniref:Diguanylate cyclase/phosphodiesterase (GGDEF & EAL domains) with PAS/PAC sensor(S) n=1 Tax=Fimbriiglobus ruber TaxID=1908690 RepID=A0A225DV31_9BACT|nr:GAF domain-containing protein [Fimbriiglobus ruber]OWK45380.1 diguanylate cyclase/phosphodiesterase (GGDEF & EAL domains) with PAS/PAC sensor(s) [Fimbriiglobus ruber]